SPWPESGPPTGPTDTAGSPRRAKPAASCRSSWPESGPPTGPRGAEGLLSRTCPVASCCSRWPASCSSTPPIGAGGGRNRAHAPGVVQAVVDKVRVEGARGLEGIEGGRVEALVSVRIVSEVAVQRGQDEAAEVRLDRAAVDQVLRDEIEIPTVVEKRGGEVVW